ncbi:hypothetical protein KYD98_17760, partial [Clostridium sp. YB-6]|nr:hypothetical protein [Clostridium weizhouense]
LKDDGSVATEWLYDQGNWYYLYPEGSMAQDTTVNGCYVNDNGEWITKVVTDEGDIGYNFINKATDEISNTYEDNSWKQDCLERGWGPLTKEAYDEKAAEAKSQATYFPIVHANEFDWGKVIWGSVTGVDTVISEDTIIVSSVSEYMANYVYNNSNLTNSSSRIEAYRKMFDIANRADDIRVVSRTLNSGGWKSLSTKIGVGGNIIAGGINIYNDINNKDYDDVDKNKAVTVDIITTGFSVGSTIAIAALIPGVGWAFAAGVVAGCTISAIGEFWKESWIK